MQEIRRVVQVLSRRTLLRAALPSAANLDAIAQHLKMACGQKVSLHDGTIFEASIFLRRAAQLVRLAINQQLEGEQETKGSAAKA